MDRRFPGGYDEAHRRQAEYEADMILKMGFPSYFLVVADFIMWAKQNGIRVGPRSRLGRGLAWWPTRWASPTSIRSSTD